MPTITEIIAEFEENCKKIGYIPECIACYNKTTDRIESFWNEDANGTEKIEGCVGTAISLVGLSGKNDAIITLAMSRAYSLHGLHYTKPDKDPQEELLRVIVGAGMEYGAQIVKGAQQTAQHAQAVQGTDNPEVIQLPPESYNGAPCPRINCFNNECGACIIYTEGEITEFEKCEYYADPTTTSPTQPVKCRRHCVMAYKGACMIFNEGEICPDTHLCERYEKYEGRNQWGV